MSPASSADVRQRIDHAFAALDSALVLAGPRVRERVPSISPWSPLDVGEHVTLADRYLLVLAEKCARKSNAKHARGETTDAPPHGIERLDCVATRDFRWESPEHMIPTGRATPETVLATLSAQRAEALTLLDSVPDAAVRAHTIRMTWMGPEVRLDVRELLAFIALHVERHAAQVRRILHTAVPRAP